MQTFRFTFNGEHELLVPDGMGMDCATDIIEGRSYPFPKDESPQVVVDIGAHVGEFTIMAALLWPAATIHAYEPYPTAVEVLRHNLRDCVNVVIHPQAVAAKGGKTWLHLSRFGTLCNSLVIRPTDDCESIAVEAVDPQAIADLQPDTLKIDAEGVEWDILSRLPLDAIHRIYLEFHCEDHRRRICRLLDETHSLWYARITQSEQGELMYVRR